MTTTVAKQSSATDLTYAALGAVMIAVCSWISIPTTVPFTMQTFAIFCVTLLLGGRRSLLAVGVYLLLGAAGVPVFAGFTAGLGILLGNTGGYMVGFLFIGPLYGLAVRLFGKKLWAEAAALLLGMAVCYAFGTAWFMLVYARTEGAVGLMTALGWCVVPFLLPDLLKLVLAFTLRRSVTKAVRRQ